MKMIYKYLALISILTVPTAYSKQSVEQEAQTMQRNLVSIHNLAFGKDNLFKNTNTTDLSTWDNLIKNQIFPFIQTYGTPQQQGEMGICMAAHIDLLTSIKRVQLPTSKLPNRALMQDIEHLRSMIELLTEIEHKQHQTFKNKNNQSAQVVLNHLTVTLNVTLTKALKDIAEYTR